MEPDLQKGLEIWFGVAAEFWRFAPTLSLQASSFTTATLTTSPHADHPVLVDLACLPGSGASTIMEEPQTDPTPDPELAAASSRSSDSLPRPGTSLLPPCSHCGLPSREERYPEDAQNRITELESQVRILTTKATGAGTFPAN